MSKPTKSDAVIDWQSPTNLPVVKKPLSAGGIALATGGAVLGLAVLAGAAVAMFHVAVTTVTTVAFLVALVAIIVLFPALLMGLNATRVRAKETIARSMPLETLIVQRKQFENLIGDKTRQLAEANGHIEDFRRLIDSNRKDMTPEDVARWESDLQVSRDALSRAQTHIADLRTDLNEFDRQITKARIDTQLAQAKGNVASALQQANLSAEDRHVTESALSEIARRAGRNAALLDEALSAGEQQSRSRAARGGAA